jgi:pyridoxamine 5'-phosphate oxidase
MSFVADRQDYSQRALSEADVGAEPMIEVARWVEEAVAAHVPEPHAMTLATVNAEGAPSARIVLARRVDEMGIVFFTNYESRKGNDLTANPNAALLFFWPTLERQIRVDGTVSRLAADESDAYFASRPLGSRLGAWASPQSRPIASREVLDEAYAKVERELANEPPRPPFWGGYLLRPLAVELWQGRPSRLHDRLAFRRVGESWSRTRLAP